MQHGEGSETRYDPIPTPFPGPLPGTLPIPLPWIPQRTTGGTQCFWCDRLHPGDLALSVCPECTARYVTMRSLGMRGSYPLDDVSIDRLITRTSAGNFALGYLDGERFSVFFVGRSDSDLRRRLHAWVDTPSRDGRYASAAKAPWGVKHSPRSPLDTPALARVGGSASAYTRFAYSYADSADDAYVKEWRNFEAFGGRLGLDNEREPSLA